MNWPTTVEGSEPISKGEGVLLLDQTAWANICDEPRGAFGAMLRHFLACLRGKSTYQGTLSRRGYLVDTNCRHLVVDSQRLERSL